MIAPLRRRHRAVTTVLAVAVPVGFVVALAARDPLPTMAADDPALEGIAVERPDPWGSEEPSELSARVDRDAGQPRLELFGLPHSPGPDGLVYLTDEIDPDALPPDARWIGAVDGARSQAFDLPPGASGMRTVLVYSLAHDRVVASAALPAPE